MVIYNCKERLNDIYAIGHSKLRHSRNVSSIICVLGKKPTEESGKRAVHKQRALPQQALRQKPDSHAQYAVCHVMGATTAEHVVGFLLSLHAHHDDTHREHSR